MDVQVEHLATVRELQDTHEDLKKKAATSVYLSLSMSVCYTLCSRSTYLSWLSFCPT